MLGLGTIINVLGVLIGGSLGLFISRGIPEKLKTSLIRVQGLAVVVMGLSGVFSRLGQYERDELILLLSLVVGTLLGELLGLEEAIDAWGSRLKAKYAREDEGFSQGFILATLTMCVGAMGILGAFNDALYGDISILLSKTVLDSFTAFMLAGYYGLGVLFSALPLALWQGGFTLLASLLAPLLTALVLHNLSLVGGVLIFAIGLNLAFDTKLPLVNMLPALLLSVALGLWL